MIHLIIMGIMLDDSDTAAPLLQQGYQGTNQRRFPAVLVADNLANCRQLNISPLSAIPLRCLTRVSPESYPSSNSPMLEALVREAGGEAVMLGAIADDLELARSKVQMALETHDLVITTGGVSVGDYDIMGDLVREKTGEMLFNKVTMRPGSVTTAAVRGGKLLLALSGNPGACFVGFQLFARPVISLMLGAAQPLLPEWTAFMGADYTKVNNYTRFVRARLEIRDGSIYAYPAGIDESSVMVTIKDSDCLIIVPPEARGLAAGDRVKILKLPGEIVG